MEIFDWVQVGVSFVVGAGGALLATWNSTRIDSKKRNDGRSDALWAYHRALIDQVEIAQNAHYDVDLNLGQSENFQECRRGAWQYLFELKDHPDFKDLQAARYQGQKDYMASSHATFYSGIAKTLETHLLNYPRGISAHRKRRAVAR